MTPDFIIYNWMTAQIALYNLVLYLILFHDGNYDENGQAPIYGLYSYSSTVLVIYSSHPNSFHLNENLLPSLLYFLIRLFHACDPITTKKNSLLLLLIYYISKWCCKINVIMSSHLKNTYTKHIF